MDISLTVCLYFTMCTMVLFIVHCYALPLSMTLNFTWYCIVLVNLLTTRHNHQESSHILKYDYFKNTILEHKKNKNGCGTKPPRSWSTSTGPFQTFEWTYTSSLVLSLVKTQMEWSPLWSPAHQLNLGRLKIIVIFFL